MRLLSLATLLCLFTAACGGKKTENGELKENLSFTQETSTAAKAAVEKYLRLAFWENSAVGSDELPNSEKRFFNEYRQFSQLCRFEFTIGELSGYAPSTSRFFIAIDVRVKALTQKDGDLSNLGSTSISLASVPVQPSVQSRLPGGESYYRYEKVWSHLTSLMRVTRPSCVTSEKANQDALTPPPSPQ